MVRLTNPNKPDFNIQAKELRWIERNVQGGIIGVHRDNPKLGYTLALDPYETQFQTEPITEILESTESIVHFKIQDIEYKLHLAKHFQDLYEKLNL